MKKIKEEDEHWFVRGLDLADEIIAKYGAGMFVDMLDRKSIIALSVHFRKLQEKTNETL